MDQLSPEERKIGQENFWGVVGSEHTRRDFIKGSIAATAAAGVGLGAHYFGYKQVDNPVRVGIIGTGDEGGVLIGALNPKYVNVVAVADIRPYNIHRAFHGDQASENAAKIRVGLMKKYGYATEDEARKKIKVYDGDYRELLKDANVEAVIIATPLFMHAPMALEAMRAGKHVLTEKLMAYTVGACKQMGRVAKETNKVLAVGHQRHYSILYDNAKDAIQRGLLGKVHHIRAQWHRAVDTWSPPLPPKLKADVEKVAADLAKEKTGTKRFDDLTKRQALLNLQLMDANVDAAKYGYIAKEFKDGAGKSLYTYSPLEELIRWRLWQRTGGGLMAELGSHQLDASGIFVSAMRTDDVHVHPLTVVAVGGRHLYPLTSREQEGHREAEDHVYCTFEFPAPEYNPQDEELRNKKVGVTYSSINGNGFGGYGEIVMGTKGTLILEKEEEVLFYGASTRTEISVTKDAKSGVIDTTASGDTKAVAVGKKALEGPVSKGYAEEIEHWAWCIRNPDPKNQPRCRAEVALGDAVIALVSNIAIREQKRIEFKKEWFEIDSDDTPEGVKPADSVKA